ncbi:MAG: hypothetical protein U9R74_01340 [Pseudomonadota bacterium]|nr:hypothetical protein [Pseudomonadota bacterium]
MLYSAGRYATDDRWNYVGVGGAGGLAGIGDLIDAAPVWEIGLALMVTFLVWYIGRRIRIRGDYLS